MWGSLLLFSWFVSVLSLLAFILPPGRFKPLSYGGAGVWLATRILLLVILLQPSQMTSSPMQLLLELLPAGLRATLSCQLVFAGMLHDKEFLLELLPAGLGFSFSSMHGATRWISVGHQTSTLCRV